VQQQPCSMATEAATPTAPKTTGQKRERPADDAVVPVPEDMALPGAAIMRIVKSKLPDGVMINKDAKVAFAKACSIFILYISTIASDVSKEGKRSTVTAQDVITALKDLEFDEFVPNIEACLAAFREADKAKVLEATAKRMARVKASGGAADGDADADADADADGPDDDAAGEADEGAGEEEAAEDAEEQADGSDGEADDEAS